MLTAFLCLERNKLFWFEHSLDLILQFTKDILSPSTGNVWQ